MKTVDDCERQARELVGARIEIPVHYDLWMRGARYGTVVGLAWERNGAGEKIVKAIRVKMDHPQVKRLARVWRIDFDCINVISKPLRYMGK